MEIIKGFIETSYFLPISLLFLGVSFYILERRYAKEILFAMIVISFVPMSLALSLIFRPDNISYSLFFWIVLCGIGTLLFLIRNKGAKLIMWVSAVLSAVFVFLLFIASLPEPMTALIAALITGILVIFARRFILSVFIKFICILLIISSLFMFDLLHTAGTLSRMVEAIIIYVKNIKILEAISVCLGLSGQFNVIGWGKLLLYTFLIIIGASIIKNKVFSKKAIQVKPGKGSLKITNAAEERYFMLFCAADILVLVTFVFLPLYAALIAFNGLFLMIAVGFIKSTAVKAGEKQFPEIHALAKEYSGKLSLEEVPEIYILNDGAGMDAFTIRALKNNAVVLSSETAQMAVEGGEEVIKFVLVHEMSHIKNKHSEKLFWLWPLTTLLFPLGRAYMRACEYTCDAYGAYFAPDGAVKGILAMAVGTKLFGKVDPKEFMKQLEKEQDVLTSIAELTSTHPALGKRLESIYKIAKTSNKEVSEIKINLS